MDEFIEGQRGNLDEVRHWRLFRDLIGALDAAYRAAVRCLPREGVPIIFGRILLVCHKSMLSAATLIAQGQPEDSTGVTRRALEGARVALAIAINDANALQWTAYRERHDRWLKRQQNEKPKHFAVQLADIRGDALIEQIDNHMGILSDASVHFTPEFYASLDWQVNWTADTEGEVYLNYFQRGKRDIEREFIALSAAHRVILETLNRCFNGLFQQDEDCRKRLAEFAQLGQALNGAYQREYGTTGQA